jgi:FAD:protein FMN transferase
VTIVAGDPGPSVTGGRSTTAPVELRHVEFAMGTAFSFAVTTGPDDEVGPIAIADAVAWLHEVERRFTTFEPGSEWMRFARGELDFDEAHPDIRHVHVQSQELTQATSGDFSLTADPHRLPDPAAYVKGWAIQHASERALAAGVESVLINGGGDVAASHRAPPWRIGIQDPHRPDGLIAIVEVHRGGVATSGCYERGAHVFDPSTGRPAHGLASATVVGPDLGLADAYSTALLASGERGLSWFGDLPGYGAYLVRDDRSTVTVGDIRLA